MTRASTFPPLTLRTLGALQLQIGVDSLRITATWTRELLLIYLAESGRQHARKFLARLLWPDSDDTVALGNLRTLLSRARQDGLAPYIVAERHQIGLTDALPVRYDAGVFRRTLSRHAQLTRAELTEVLGLYRGPFLFGVPLSDNPELEAWIHAVQRELEQFAIVGLRRLYALCLEDGDVDAAVASAQRLTHLAPYDDESHIAYMRALIAVGRFGDATQHFAAYRRTLADELDLSDGTPQLEAFRRELAASTGSVRPANTALHQPVFVKTPAHAPVPPRPAGPQVSIPLIGRARELQNLRDHVLNQSTRLLSLVGIGGVGKTRLVIALADYVAAEFTDGVLFVDLSDEPAPAAHMSTDTGALHAVLTVERAIAQSLNLNRLGDRPLDDLLLQALAQMHALLILDNMEHLLGATEFLARLVEAAPRLRVVVTSRTPLGMLAEHIVRVEGFMTPDITKLDALEQADGVRLFLSIARRRQPYFVPTQEQLVDIADLCRRVDGHPLSLVLAAIWSTAMSPPVVGHDLMKLRVGAPDIPGRHRSIATLLESIWGHLTQPMRTTLAKMSVLVSPFDAEAARDVAGADANMLALMTQDALVTCFDHGYYRLHPLVREYAAAMLHQGVHGATAEAVSAVHARYFVQRTVERTRIDPGDPHLLHTLANLRLALSWYMRHDQQALIGILPELDRFWMRHGLHAEGSEWLAALLNTPLATRTARAHILRYASKHAQCLYRMKTAESTILEAIDLLDPITDAVDIMQCYVQLGWVMWDSMVRFEDAVLCLERARAIARECADDLAFARISNGLALCWHWQDPLRAHEYLKDAAARLTGPQVDPIDRLEYYLTHLYLAHRQGRRDAMHTYFELTRSLLAASSVDAYAKAWVLLILGEKALALGLNETAICNVSAALELFAQCSAYKDLAFAYNMMSSIAVTQADWRTGEHHARAAFDIALQADHPVIWLSLTNIATCRIGVGDFVAATPLLAAVQTRLAQFPSNSQIFEFDEFRTLTQHLEAAETLLGVEHFNELRQIGAQLPVEQLMDWVTPSKERRGGFANTATHTD